MQQNQEFRVSVAPMMDWTDRHCRWFHRQLSKRIWLYTEMVVADAVIHGNRDYLIGYHADEHPVVLQIGGSDPAKLADASKVGEEFGYDEININIGCPSDRVQSGSFGACLMLEPALVADCFAAMQAAVNIPVTVKCRLGVDDQNVEKTLPEFMNAVSEAGCKRVIIHARKAWLKGLSPKENRDVPPLDYGLVREMKNQFPHIAIELNGGLQALGTSLENAKTLDGIMLGRAAYHTPWILTQVDQRVHGASAFSKSREEIAEEVIRFVEYHQDNDRSAKAMVRHIMGLYAAMPGARMWRRTLSETIAKGVKPSEAIRAGLSTRNEFQLEPLGTA